MNGLTVKREITVPNTGTQDFARTIDVFYNPTASPITTIVKIVGNLGSDAATTVFATGNGDTTPSVDDQWIGTDDADGTGTPALIHYIHGPLGAKPTDVQVVGDNIFWTYNLTVPAGQTVRLASYTVVAASRASAIAAANALVNPTAFGGEAARFLTNNELASLTNFQFDHPPVANAGGPYSILYAANVTLNGSASSDPDVGDSIVKYEWDLTNDGIFDLTTTSAILTVPWTTLQANGVTSGANTVALRVTDTFGVTSVNTTTLTVGEAPSAPTVTSVAPFVGPTTGGTTVVIVGIEFLSATAVKFDGVDAASFTINSASQITAVAPAHAAATVNVTVTNGIGVSDTAASGDNYTYALPAVTSVVVNGGSIGARDRYGNTPALAGQSSVVEQILVTFNQAVTVDANAFTITSLAAAVTASVAMPTTANIAVQSTPVAGTGNESTGYTQFILTFVAGEGVNSFDNGTNGGLGNAFTTIKEGLFELNTVGSKIHAGLDTAADRADRFWSIYAAVNPADVTLSKTFGDGSSKLLVDGIALGEMYQTFGSFANVAGPPAYSTPYDCNLDGIVDGIDLGKMYANFGTQWLF